MAWTQVGGEILFIESLLSEGKGKLTLTGNLGDVMKESATTALSYLKSNAKTLGIDVKNFQEKDIHIHVPEGAIPKDGPSAGIAIYTTLVSLMTKTPVSRHVAMTGEITLRGKVLPIGGLKEKMLAAKRGGIKTVLIPKDNIKDLKDIPDNIKDNLEVIPVATIDEVLKHAFVQKGKATAKKK